MDEMELKKEDSPIANWFKELDLSLKRDKYWRDDAKIANTTYRNERNVGSGDNAKRRDTFNILWSNVETVRPALYSALPKPDIRRRFRDEDALAMHVSEILERATSFVLENTSFDGRMIDATNDLLLPGRGTTRIKYVPTMSEGGETEDGVEIEQVVESEEIEYESIKWDSLLLGPGDNWDELPWIAFEHQLDKEQVMQISPDFADKLSYGNTVDPNLSQSERNDAARVTQQARVYEIWDKIERKVRWVAWEFKDDFIAIDDDPLNLKDFWPIPKPCYAIESSQSLVPITDFSMYQTLADNLEDVTNRMSRITRALRVRGIYDSTMSEIKKLFDANDNDMIPAENLSRLIEKGGIDKAIWMFPNETLTNVLLQLWQYRTQTIQQIYELTGISDIQRGSSNAHETLGAQKIKANFGSQRLQRKQREIQRYARDLIRMTVEIVGEQFSPETLMAMTGLKFPTQQQKAQMQMQIEQAKMTYQQQAQQAQMQGQQPPPEPQMPPEMEEMMSKPTWEELKAVMSDDILRSYRIEIETDSTIQADQQADQEALSVLMQSIAQFSQGIQPAIESGLLDENGAKKLLQGFLKRFRLGREVEEAIMESSGDAREEAKQAEQQAQQQEQQAKQQEQQAKQQEQELKNQGLQAKTQADQAQSQADMQKTQMDAQVNQAEHAQKMAEIQLKAQVAQAKFQQDMQLIAAKGANNGE